MIFNNENIFYSKFLNYIESEKQKIVMVNIMKHCNMKEIEDSNIHILSKINFNDCYNYDLNTGLVIKNRNLFSERYNELKSFYLNEINKLNTTQICPNCQLEYIPFQSISKFNCKSKIYSNCENVDHGVNHDLQELSTFKIPIYLFYDFSIDKKHIIDIEINKDNDYFTFLIVKRNKIKNI